MSKKEKIIPVRVSEEQYEFLVSGAICTQNSTIDYPLKCCIPPNVENQE